ncbi:MAG: BON domain-containing protein [Polyangiaceae bacterium]|nr:BON domain-containing protein [Polyangiaceae bacterium]
MNNPKQPETTDSGNSAIDDPTLPTASSEKDEGYQNRGAVGFEDANLALEHSLRSELAGKLHLDTTKLVITVTDEEISLSGAVENTEQKSGVASLAAVVGASRKIIDHLHITPSAR